MDKYAIKDGRDFIVQSEEQSVLKCTSRRKAVKTVAVANGLMRANGDPASKSNANETSDQG